MALLAFWQRWYVLYLTQAAIGQASLLWRARPIARVLQTGHLPEAHQAKLRLVLEAKSFAERQLGLRASSNYTAFADVGPGPVSYAVTACPAERLEYHRWWFPVIGWVPYLGFFRRQDAWAAAHKLDQEGYDSDVREVPAYSTLGWFSDPVASPMLRYSDHDLVATIIHELTHGTLYLPGQGDFNESLATFVGMRGAIGFFCRSSSPACQEARQGWEDTLAFAQFIDRLARRLDALLQRPVTRAVRLREKARLLKETPSEFIAWQKRLGRPAFDGFRTRKLNNAVILSLYLYYRHLHLFEAAYRRQHGDVRGFLGRVRNAVASAPDPLAAVRALR